MFILAEEKKPEPETVPEDEEEPQDDEEEGLDPPSPPKRARRAAVQGNLVFRPLSVDNN